MKKTDLKRIALVVFAVAALFFASIPGAVKVYSVPSEQTQTPQMVECTYFTLVEGVTGAVSLPAAALCAGIAVMLSGIYAVKQKKGLLTALKAVAMVGAILAVVPILFKGTEVMILPSVLVPILLLAEYVTAKLLTKPRETPAQEPTGRRLK